MTLITANSISTLNKKNGCDSAIPDELRLNPNESGRIQTIFGMSLVESLVKSS